MTTILNKFLSGKFNTAIDLKQIGANSWIVNEESPKALVIFFYWNNFLFRFSYLSYVLNRFESGDKKAQSAYKINEILYKNTNNTFKSNFIFYEDHKIVDDYYFVLVEYCRVKLEKLVYLLD